MWQQVVMISRAKVNGISMWPLRPRPSKYLEVVACEQRIKYGDILLLLHLLPWAKVEDAIHQFQDSYKTNFHQTLFYTVRIRNRLSRPNTQLLGIKGSKIPKDQPTESQTDQIQLTYPWPLPSPTFFNPIEVQLSTDFCTLCTLVFDDVYLYTDFYFYAAFSGS